MARSHHIKKGEHGSPQHDGWTNPEVRYERKDISFWDIVKLSAVLVVALHVVVGAVLWYSFFLTAQENRRKVTDLPPASVDSERLPPESQPRLEGIEDLRHGGVQLFPPRAELYFRPQAELLAKGDPQKGIQPIDQTINELAKHGLPARKDAKAAPAEFTIRLPSKAAAGRVETGGRER